MTKPPRNRRPPPARSPGLSAASRRLFRELSAVYAITDVGGREILHSGLRAKDQAEAAEARISHDGQSTVDRFNQVRAHPLLAVARDFRAQWLAALRALNLATGSEPKIGRPEGS